MSRPNYDVGDMIVLKSGLTRTAAADRRCRVISVLPNDHGHVQYRIQFATENFERRITEGDIDAVESQSRVSAAAVEETEASGPWLKASSMKIGKRR